MLGNAVKNYGQYMAFAASILLASAPLLIGLSGTEELYSPQVGSGQSYGSGSSAPESTKQMPWGRQQLDDLRPSSKDRDAARVYIARKNGERLKNTASMGWNFASVDAGFGERGVLRVLWSNGWAEEIAGDLYRMIDPSGIMVVERLATADDISRLNEMVSFADRSEVLKISSELE